MMESIIIDMLAYAVLFLLGVFLGIKLKEALVLQNVYNFYIWLAEQPHFTPNYEETFRAAVGAWKPWEGKGTRQ